MNFGKDETICCERYLNLSICNEFYFIDQVNQFQFDSLFCSDCTIEWLYDNRVFITLYHYLIKFTSEKA